MGYDIPADHHGPTPSDEERRLMGLEFEYRRAMHGVQSGVAMCQTIGINTSCSPLESDIGIGQHIKHLRTGIDSAMVNDAALVELLIKKGVITREEYFVSLVEQAEQEKKRYEDILSRHFQKNITLG